MLNHYCILDKSGKEYLLFVGTSLEARSKLARFQQKNSAGRYSAKLTLWLCDIVYSDTGEIRQVLPLQKVA